MPERPSTKINTGDKSATKSTVADTFDFIAGFGDCGQNGDNLNIYESRDNPVTSDVISIQ